MTTYVDGRVDAAPPTCQEESGVGTQARRTTAVCDPPATTRWSHAEVVELPRHPTSSLSDAYDMLLHELRTPLAAASVAVDVASAVYAGPAAEMLNVAALAILDAQRVVRYFSQMRAFGVGDALLHVEPHAVRSLIDRACALVPAVRVEIMAPDTLPTVAADGLWLTHALANILDNAAKHADVPDPVQVVASMSTEGWVTISARDMGLGIPLAQQEGAFGRRGRDGCCDDLTSQGLGLSLARSFVTAMGGELLLESDGQTGTTVSLVVPIVTCDER